MRARLPEELTDLRQCGGSRRCASPRTRAGGAASEQCRRARRAGIRVPRHGAGGRSLLCHWVCTVQCLFCCHVVCGPPPLRRPQLAEELARAVEQLCQLLENEKLFEATADGFRIGDRERLCGIIQEEICPTTKSFCPQTSYARRAHHNRSPRRLRGSTTRLHRSAWSVASPST